MKTQRQGESRAGSNQNAFRMQSTPPLKNTSDTALAAIEMSCTQSSLIRTLQAMIGVVEKPLAVVSLIEDRGASELLCATRGAELLFTTPEKSTPVPSCIQAFLEHCRKLKDASRKYVLWSSPKGENYRLVCKERLCHSVETLLIHFIPDQPEHASRPDKAQLHARKRDLTPGEERVFELMARGLCNKEIANALKLSVHTVRAHLRNIFKLLNVSSRVEAMHAVRQTR